MKSVNPATEELISEYAELSPSGVQHRLHEAEEARPTWRQTPLAERAEAMKRVAELLGQERQSLARLMTDEMGKPIAAAEAEIDKCAWVCQFFAEHAAEFLAPREVETEARRSFVRFDPLGAVLAIMPWNFPFWQVFRWAAPCLMAGNVGLLKHASNVCGSALAIEELFRQAGFPPGVFATLLVTSESVPDLIAQPEIAAVTLTGSGRAGTSVGSTAGKHLKKSVLELGGSDPFIVLADADPLEAARQAVKARAINTGQSCIAAKRFIVEEAIAETFEQAMADEMQKLKIGDPLDRDIDMGPLARGDLLEALRDQVVQSVAQGARLATGGKRLGRKGYFYEATVLTGVEPGMAAFDEETFGPVAAITRARDAEQAVELANRSKYGLGASLWTAYWERGAELAARIDAGCVFINAIVKSDPRLPFGGVKHSGYGRELAEFGIHEFVNIKTVWAQ